MKTGTPGQAVTSYRSRTPLKLSRETVAELKPASTASCTYGPYEESKRGVTMEYEPS